MAEDFENYLNKNSVSLKNVIYAATILPLNRYALREGKIYGDPSPQSKLRFKVVRISNNDIAYKNLINDKMQYKNVDELLNLWNNQGYKEISQIDGVLAVIKKYLTPLIGAGLVAILINWVLKNV